MIFSTLPLRDSARLWLMIIIACAIAITFGVYTWIFASQTTTKMDDVDATLLPLLRSSSAFSRTVAQCAAMAEGLAKETDLAQLQVTTTTLLQNCGLLEDGVEMLSVYNFQAEAIAGFHAKIDTLIANLHAQKQHTAKLLTGHEALLQALKRLSLSQQQFTAIGEDMSVAYATPPPGRSNVDENRQHVNITTATGQANSPLTENGADKAELNSLSAQTKLTPLWQKQSELEIPTNSPESPINEVLELMTTTSLLTGILRQAANSTSSEEIETLQRQFAETETLAVKIQPAIFRSAPENDLLLTAFTAIIHAGKGENSIFKLRTNELLLHNNSQLSILTTGRLLKELAHDVDAFIDAGSQYAQDSMKTLKQNLQKNHATAAITLIIAIASALAACYLYLTMHFIRRIGSLRQALAQRAEGLPPAFPGNAVGDEINYINSALNKIVSERDQAVEKLAAAQLALNEAHQLAKIGNCYRNHSNHIWHWSNGFYSIIGYLPSELQSSEESFWKIVHPEDRLKIELIFNTLSSASEAIEGEFRLIAKNGKLRTVHTLWKPIISSSVSSSVSSSSSAYTQHGTIQDITERKQLTDDLLKIRKMESIAVLAGGIAHDFNNLLTGILGNLSLAGRLTTDNQQVQEHLQLSEKAALRARDLTNKLLIFSSGGNPITSITHLPQILKEAVDSALSGSTVDCQYFLDNNLWPVDMDATHFHQIMQNLIINADQAMPTGGTISIQCSNQYLRNDSAARLPSGPYVKITITDYGIGIPSQHLEKIFDPYFSTKGFYTDKGSGLGLAIVHAIICKHGGAIKAASLLGKGSRFTLHIPAIPSPVSRLQANHRLAGEEGRIVIMDHDKKSRALLKKLLIKLGYKVYPAKDGKEALAIYDSLYNHGIRIDAVIMDLIVPAGMGGKEAAQLLLKRYPLTKIIVASANTSDPVVENYQLFGFCNTIKKPFQLEELAKTVASVFSESLSTSGKRPRFPN